MNTRNIGTGKEKTACEYLEKNGIKIIERNFRCKLGEIDVIGSDGAYLIFFEIKYRKNDTKGYAPEAVGYKKQKRICKVSDYYRMIHGCPADTPIRFDVVAIDGAHIEWFRNAFFYMGT